MKKPDGGVAPVPIEKTILERTADAQKTYSFQKGKNPRLPVGFREVMQQVDFVFDYALSAEQKRNLRKVILSNNGSVLDEATFSSTALLYFIAKMNCHPVLRRCR